MYMFGMLSTLNFIFVMTIWDDIFVFFSLSHFCVVSLSFQAHPGAKADLNDGMYANALVGSI